MSKICTSGTTWTTQEVVSPVETWANQQQRVCKQYPWWDPRGWFCWFVTILVKVVVWVVKYVLVPISETVCIIVTWVVGWFLNIFAIIIDVLFPRYNASACITAWFITPTKITFVKKIESSTTPGAYDYEFVCNCNPINKPSITVQANSDGDAAELSTLKCEKECG